MNVQFELNLFEIVLNSSKLTAELSFIETSHTQRRGFSAMLKCTENIVRHLEEYIKT